MFSEGGISFRRCIVAVGRTDMRLGIDGLAAVRMRYGLDPLDKGTLFLFCGKKKDRFKGLLWTGDRFIMLYVRLADGSFQWPRTEDEARELTGGQFMRLMEGYTIDPCSRSGKDPAPKERYEGTKANVTPMKGLDSVYKMQNIYTMYIDILP